MQKNWFEERKKLFLFAHYNFCWQYNPILLSDYQFLKWSWGFHDLIRTYSCNSKNTLYKEIERRLQDGDFSKFFEYFFIAY